MSQQSPRILPPGIYNLVACERNDDPFLYSACLDPDGAHNGGDDVPDDFACQQFYTRAMPIAHLPGRDDVLVLRLDLGDVEIEGSSVQTPYGPLTISDHYAIVPAERITRNASPGDQYASNWISFELTGEQPLVVEGSRIGIGGMEIDPAAMGDVELTEYMLDGEMVEWSDARDAGRGPDVVRIGHVARTGDKLHDILVQMPRELDDGVIVMLFFTPEQLVEIEWLGTPAADAYARRIRRQMANGRAHFVVRPAIA